MITATQIRNGQRYLSRHLSANDYYSEGESVTGRWVGKAAKQLQLGAEVKAAEFEALRTNRHPKTGEKLTPRSPKVAFHDVVVSAPKAFSIAAMVGQDERLKMAFSESTDFIFRRLEQHAAVRLRSGENVRTEAVVRTGNAVAACFIHDTSRLLDPQVHAHLVFANVSMRDGRWFALQPRQMLEVSKESLRKEFLFDLAKRARNLGYNVSCDGVSFKISGISETVERKFSLRAVQKEGFESRYYNLFGSAPSKERVEQFIKEGKGEASKRFQNEFFRCFNRPPSAAEIAGFVRDFRSASMSTSSRSSVLAQQWRDFLTRKRRRSWHSPKTHDQRSVKKSRILVMSSKIRWLQMALAKRWPSISQKPSGRRTI